MFSPWRTAGSGGPQHGVLVLKGGYEVDDNSLSTRSHVEKTKSHGYKLYQGQASS